MPRFSSFASASRRLLPVVAVLALTSSLPLSAGNADPKLAREEQLRRGEVVVGLRNVGQTKYVTGTILIDQPAEHVWPIMTNPYEFQGKISPRMKTIEMMVDKTDESVMKVTLDVAFFLPHFNYVTHSRYRRNERIDFNRVGGTLRDFSGSWEMSPADAGKKTELTYAMYVDPGFYVPQWIVREGMKRELPEMLNGLKKRVAQVYHGESPLEKKSILASRPTIKLVPPATAASLSHAIH